MRLQIRDEELYMQLEIRNWKNPQNENNDGMQEDYWCVVDMPLKTDYLDYRVYGEVWTSGEVVRFRELLSRFLKEEMHERVKISFIEPDLEFELYPTDKLMLMQVTFIQENGCISNGVFTYSFNREEVKLLYQYLQLITGEIDIEYKAIQAMIKHGELIEGELP